MKNHDWRVLFRDDFAVGESGFMGRVATRSVAPIDRNKDSTQSGHRTSGHSRVAPGGFGPAPPQLARLHFVHVAVTTAVHLDVYGPKNADRNACRNNGPFVTRRQPLVGESEELRPFSRCDQAGSK
jgi:hypothetical protein